MSNVIRMALTFLVILIILQVCSNKAESDRRSYVDVELIIAVDVSGSINTMEYNLQKDGVILAFRSPEFKSYIENNKYGISVLYMEWSNYNEQSYTNWYRIHNVADAFLFTQAVNSIGRDFKNNTSISGAMIKANELFTMNPYPGFRKVLDISGDGKNNSSPREFSSNEHLIIARSILLENNVTINGLPVISNEDISLYYKTEIIGGAASFSMVANSFEEFATIFLRKLLAEIG